jgi:hypothetical protein
MCFGWRPYTYDTRQWDELHKSCCAFGYGFKRLQSATWITAHRLRKEVMTNKKHVTLLCLFSPFPKYTASL